MVYGNWGKSEVCKKNSIMINGVGYDLKGCRLNGGNERCGAKIVVGE